MKREIKRVELISRDGETTYLQADQVAHGVCVILDDDSVIFVGDRDGYDPLSIWREDRDGMPIGIDGFNYSDGFEIRR